MKRNRTQSDLEKYEHELTTLEHIRDYVQMKIDIVMSKIEECRHLISKDDLDEPPRE